MAEVEQRIKDARMGGKLKAVNREYREYREREIAQGKPAIPYSAYLQCYTEIIIARIAANGRAV